MTKMITAACAISVPASFQFDLELTEEEFLRLEALEEGDGDQREELARILVEKMGLPTLPEDHPRLYAEWFALGAELSGFEEDKSSKD